MLTTICKPLFALRRFNEEQIIWLPDRWRHLSSDGWRVRKSSVVCLHNNAIVARCILDTNITLWATRTASVPSILLVLLEPHCCLSSVKKYHLVTCHDHNIFTFHQPIRFQNFEQGKENG